MKHCIVCGGDSYSAYTQKSGYSMWQCRGCGLLFLDPLPTEDQLKRIYGEGYFTGGEDFDGYMDYDYEKHVTRKTFERYLDEIQRWSPPGSLFEVGAATGYFLSMARGRGWSVSGVEYSDYAARKARGRGLDVQTGTMGVLNDTHASYDAVVLLDVFEHLLYPREDLARIRTVLKPGGLLVLATPDRGSLFARVMGRLWHAIVPPQHTTLFSRKNLTRLLEREGFTVVRVRAIGKWFTLQYLLRVLHTWLGWRPLFFAARILSGTRAGRFSFPLNLFDTMFLIARRRQ